MTDSVEAAIATTRDDVARLHAELVRYGLVVWTGGNVSGRVPGTDYFVIKPSGVAYDDLTAENMILCDLDGNVVPGTPGSDRSPSSDTAAHAYVYREMPEVGGVVHTHSTYAVAWAARGEEIPCVITGMGPTSSAAPSRSARSRSSATTRSVAASSTPSAGTARAPCSCRTTDRSRSAPPRRMPSRPP